MKMHRLPLMTISLAILALMIWAKSVSLAQSASTSIDIAQLTTLAPSPVTIYLHNATDVTGTLQRVDAKGYQLLTSQGNVLTIAPKSYQGMVLDTPAEKTVAKSITTDPIIYMAAARYAFAIRQSLKSRLAAVHPSPDLNCWVQGSPVVHFVILNTGRIISPRLLATSQCPQANATLLRTVAQLSPPPLPTDISKLTILPINYVWAAPSSAITTPSVKNSHATNRLSK
jgi:hypothetical protein